MGKAVVGMNRADCESCDWRGPGGLVGTGLGGGGARLDEELLEAGALAGAPDGGGLGGGPGAGPGAGLVLELAAARRSVDSSMLGSSPSVCSSSELFLMPYMKYIAKPAQGSNSD